MIAALIAITVRQYIPFYRNYESLLYLMFVVALPFIFQASKESYVDRWVGTLSYPIYIVHDPILLYLRVKHTIGVGLIAVVLTMAVGVVLVIVVDQPLERFRQSPPARMLGQVGVFHCDVVGMGGVHQGPNYESGVKGHADYKVVA